jgi:integrase
MNRAPKGHGSVNLLPNGRWLAKIPVDRHSNGTTRYRTKAFERKNDARRWLNEMFTLKEQKLLGAGKRQTLEKYATEVLLYGNERISARTRDGYLRSLAIHVYPSLGNRPLDEIRPRELETLFGQIRKNHRSSTVNNVRTALSRVFTTAIRHELIYNNPVSRTKKARKSEFEDTQVKFPWSEEEVRKALIAASGSPMEAILTVVLATGMRRGELLGLWWSDIDFDSQTVSIERTIHRERRSSDDANNGGIVVCPPKTKSSRRINQLAPPVLDVLRRHQMEQDLARQGAGERYEGILCSAP